MVSYWKETVTMAKVDKPVLRIKYKKPKVYDKGCHKRILPCEWQSGRKWRAK